MELSDERFLKMNYPQMKLSTSQKLLAAFITIMAVYQEALSSVQGLTASLSLTKTLQLSQIPYAQKK